MARQIIWLPKAEERFEEIIIYLQENWSDKEVTNFIKRTEAVLRLIYAFPNYIENRRRKISTKLLLLNIIFFYTV